MRYQVVDSRTGAVKGTYTSHIRARRKADALGNEYGAFRYYVKGIAA